MIPIVLAGGLLPFATLRRTYYLPRSMEFQYCQLKHAMRARFPKPIVLDSDPIERLLSFRVIGKPLSYIYLPMSVAHEAGLSPTFER